MQKGYRYELTDPIGRNFDPEFKPELTPAEMLALGVFCGKYRTDCRKEFFASWFKKAKLSPKGRDCSLNYFGVDASRPLSEWRLKGWIHDDDPRGWFQWYCRYYMGRRMPEEDRRQIKRWKAFRRHVNQIKMNCEPGDLFCRPRPGKLCCTGHTIVGRFESQSFTASRMSIDTPTWNVEVCPRRSNNDKLRCRLNRRRQMQALYTATATAVGGRKGAIKSSDGVLNLKLAYPKELGGPGGASTNPEQLFAAGYAACFENALLRVARERKQPIRESKVTAHVTIGRNEKNFFELAVQLEVSVAEQRQGGN